MPSWKKVIVSGSDASLNSLIVPSITGSLQGTASFAITSSYAINAAIASISNASLLTQLLVINQTGTTINKGIVVRISGSNNASDIPRITTASYEDDSVSANTLGIVSANITDGSQGYVITEGVLTGISTTGWSSGTLIFLGPTGSIIASAPQAPLHAVRLGQVIREQNNNGSISIRVDNGYELNELHDVDDNTTTASYGDLLVKSGSVWTNSRQLTGSYALTGSLTVTGSTTADLVRITQTGTGNAFVVEDSANPDATPFVIDASGNTMIGTTSSLGPLTVRGNGAAGVTIETDVAANQELQSTRLFFKISGSGNDISMRNYSGSFLFATRGTSGTSSGTSAMFISGSGDVGIGSGFITSAARSASLQVSGNISIETGFAYKQDGSNVIYIAKGADSFYANTIGGPSAGTSGLLKQTVYGWSAGASATGSYQVAVGTAAGYLNKRDNQSAFGHYAGYLNSGSTQTTLGMESGYINAGDNQTVVGYQAGYLNTGSNQTTVGWRAGRYNSGSNQVAMGILSGESNIGTYQTALGTQAGYQNTGSQQTAVGGLSGYLNSGSGQTTIGYTSGQYNIGDSQTAVGYGAGQFNTASLQSAFGYYAGRYNSGVQQTAVGYQAGYQNTGSNQTAIGTNAGYANLGIEQTAVGSTAGSRNIGSNQTVVGFQAGRLNTGSFQTAVGYNAGLSNAVDYQIAIGGYAGYLNTGSNQVAIGYYAGAYNSGSDNTNIGHLAGHYITGTTGINSQSLQSVFLGSFTKAGGTNRTNQIVIGYNASGIGDNSVVLGNDSIITTALKGNVGIGTTTPSASLEVYNATDSSLWVNSAGNSYLKLKRGSIAADAHISFDTTTTQKHIVGLINNTDSLVVGGTEATPVITISGSNVGIGTTAPTKPLVINTSGNDPILVNNTNATAFNRIVFQKSSQTWSAGATNSNDFVIGDENAVTYRLLIASGTGNWNINSNKTGSVSIGYSGIPSAKLHINNTTSGNSFLVEDDTNPDTTPFVIDTAGSVGIGILTPSASLHTTGSVIVSGSMVIGSSSLGPFENTLTLGARDNGSEGGQLGFSAPGGTYTSASMIDLYQNRLRILKGTNAGSTGEAAWWSMHNLQMALPAYNSTSAFPGTAVGYLAFDSSGNIITVAGAGSAVNIGNTDLTITSNATRTLSHAGTSRFIITGSSSSYLLELQSSTTGNGRGMAMQQLINAELNRSAVRATTAGGNNANSTTLNGWASDHLIEYVSGSGVAPSKLKGWSWSYFDGVGAYNDVLLISTSNEATLNASLTITGSARITGSFVLNGSITIGNDTNTNLDLYGFIYGSGSYLNGVSSNNYTTYSSILGGVSNKIHTGGTRNVILGGLRNSITGSGLYGGHNDSVIIGGSLNNIDAGAQADSELIAVSYSSSILDANRVAIIASDISTINNGSNISIIASYGSTNTAPYTAGTSAIIGGTYNRLGDASRSVILGGSYITASANDTVYMPNAVITGSVTVNGNLNSTGGSIDMSAMIQASLLYLSNNF